MFSAFAAVGLDVSHSSITLLGCRGKAARPGAHSAQVTSVVTEMNSTPGLVVGSGRDNVKIESGRVSSGSIPANSNLTPTMAVPFYAGTEVWPASSPADPWTAQGQFIHQIDDIRYQHYPGYQTAGYQQTGFITDQTSAFQPQYTNASNGNPSTSPAQGNVTPRSSGSYTQVHTPTPSPNPSTPHVNGHRNGINVHYIEENYVNGNTYNTDATMVPPASTTPNSRSSSGQIEETNNKTTNYMSGNEIPGYPQNSPQCQSSCNSSGYPGQSLQSEYGDQTNETSYQVNATSNHVNQKSPSYAQASPGTYQTYQNFNQISPEQHQKSPKPGMSPGSCHPSQKPSGMYPQNSPNSNPSPQSYQQISPGQSRNAGHPGNGSIYMDQQRHYGDGYAGQSPQHFNSEFPSQGYSPSQDKNTVNARIKSMIMNKHQMSQNRPNSNYSASNENHLASPGREMMSPNHQMTQNSPMQNQLMSPNNHMISNSSPNSKDFAEKKQGQVNENANHFLAFSHHLRDGRVLQPEGGGVRNWADPIGPNQFIKNTVRHNDSISAMENFMRFASAELEKTGLDARRTFPQHSVAFDGYKRDFSDPIRNLEANFPTKRNVNSIGTACDKFESFARQRDCRRKSPNYFGKSPNYGTEFFGYRPPNGRNNNSYCNYSQKSASGCGDYLPQIWGVKTEVVKNEEPEADLSAPKVEPPDNLSMRCDHFDPKMDGNVEDSPYQRISYAPNAPKMEVIDLRFVKTEPVNREKWEKYQKATEKERADAPKKESYRYEGDGGPVVLEDCVGAWCCRRGGIETPTQEHLRDGCCQGLQTADEIPPEKDAPSEKNVEGSTPASSADSPKAEEKSPCPENGKDFQDNADRLKNNVRSDVPDCQCFPPDKCPPEPGSYYTHLGAAASLLDLRKEVETRTGQTGKALRIEKICYTGKEGKTTQGCPLAKWVIRRSSIDEKFLIVVKHRQGHTCSTAWIVVCMVAWEGVPSSEADRVYSLLSHKLNRFGLPTTRRCATNEPRTCACQGLDPDTCGASFSFGCSWSMYYNGCKYARSKTVRKFRLSVRSEEQEVEERMHVLATLLSPLYSTLAPEAFQNQTAFEREASECRLGFKPGRPFSGVTACIDFCAHSHRDLHNMNNGCTVVVSLTKHRTLAKPEDEQLHVLPLYIMDETDEYGCKESQEAKYKDGSIECLKKFPCEVRVRAVPLQPCRRHGKKRKDDEVDAVISNGKPKDLLMKNPSPILGNNASPMHCLDLPSVLEGMDGQLQSSQVSSTVMDSPVGMYQGWGYHGMSENEMYNADGQWNKAWPTADASRKQNWMNPPSQWDYSGYLPDRDVDPDSTTMQNQNSVACSNLVAGSFQSNASWQQQVTDSRGHNLSYDDSKLGLTSKKEFRPVGNGKNSPQNWSDYPVTQSPSDSVFRIPKGRPPSRPNPAPTSTEPDHFLKPFPKDNHSTSMHADCSEAGKHWPTNRSESFQNMFNSNQNAFNPEYQNNGYDIQNYNWNYPEYLEDRFGYNQNFSPVPGRWDLYGPGPFFPLVPETPKSEPIGEVTDYIDNEECFRDSQMGGVAIALGHGSVLFECAKHELHATTALRRPNRLHPTRISLVFYQHRNLNRAKHGWDEWEEKMRLRKLGINVTPDKKDVKNPEEADVLKLAGLERPLGPGERMLVRVPTYTTTTWTTLFPMRPCMVTGPYQEGGND
ncbi:UNVERIFIED_CONTAM: hypothetical protein PYX00_009071 [Menopon gallinae]|uniref:Methylcytosine dioxygenase TET n=1 Tax=Menopon gallinae TaxID=328185 RepID=A0AAW2HA85_9NEOP